MIMPKKVKTILCLVLTSGMFTMVWYAITICPMRAVFNIWSEHKQKLVVASSTDFNARDVELLAKMLADNDELFYINGSKIMITPGFFFEKELLLNHTTKTGMSYHDGNYYHEYNLWGRKQQMPIFDISRPLTYCPTCDWRVSSETSSVRKEYLHQIKRHSGKAV